MLVLAVTAKHGAHEMPLGTLGHIILNTN